MTITLLVIPGRHGVADPESMIPVCEYGFRVRAFGAPRNDEKWEAAE